jgi:triacylglycerol esterase/lipase EstA (alpha/beta hydrolase family)
VSAWWGEVLTGLRVFGWRQPFRSNELADASSDRPGRRGVLLVHGFVCNRGMWNPWMRRLQALGTPYIAVNLEPIFGSIDRYVQTIDAAVARLERATRCAPVVVAHSMGGLAVRAWLQQRVSERRVHSVVTIGTPHAGTWLARFAMTTNGRQMRESSQWLQQLQARESRDCRALFTCYFGHCDNIVFPARNATLPDAANRHVPGVAHVHLAFHRPILDDVLKRIAA